jgi:hypothetical protein
LIACSRGQTALIWRRWLGRARLQEAAVLKDADPHHGQGSHLAVCAILIGVLLVAMAIVGPLLTPEQPGQSRLPPIVLLFQSR